MMEAEAPCKNSIPDKTMEPDEEPQRKNCVLALLQTFPAETPLVTRYTIYTLILSYALSFFWDTTKALSSLPIMMVKHQLYRLVSSPLVCTSGWTLIFSISSMSYYGKKLEYSVGSTTFATLILIFGGLTNLIYVHVCFILCAITSEISWLRNPSHGFWMVLLGLISMEASMAPPGSMRRFFSLEIPATYYPLILLVIFALMSGGDGLPMSYFISTALGYGIGLGHLEQLKLSVERRSRWESSLLRKFTSRKGWVSGPSGNEWTTENNGGKKIDYTPTLFREGKNIVQRIPSFEAFRGTKGHVLGGSSSSSGVTAGPTRRVTRSPTRTVKDRSALLTAAETRATKGASSTQEMSEQP